MGDEWTRRLHDIGISDDSGSYMSIMHYDSCFSKFILYNSCAASKSMMMMHYLTHATIQRGHVTNIQAGSHSATIFTL